MDPIVGVDFLQGDFREEAVLDTLLNRIGGANVDVVLSDMAPNMSGVKVSDQSKAMYLVELAIDFADQSLKPEGDLLMKVFQGQGFDQIMNDLKKKYKKVITRKPKASRPRSPEVYLLARGFKA